MRLLPCIRSIARFASLLFIGIRWIGAADSLPISYQVNIGPDGKNIPQDAANEPSLCVDPTNPLRMAVGWRQFDHVTNDFRKAGYGYTTNGGLNWLFGGTLQSNVFRSDPVLSSDANGQFYYLSLQANYATLNTAPNFHGDIWKSLDSGASWQRVANAVGGDKPWMTVDKSFSPGRGNIYQCWSDVANNYGTRVFSRSRDGGSTWLNPINLPGTPNYPYWSTVDTGPNGELVLLGWSDAGFVFLRSRNATNASANLVFDLKTAVDMGGDIDADDGPNPGGLLGQPWIAADRSTGPTRGNLYALCSVSRTFGGPTDVMFSRSTNGGANWSNPVPLNNDSARQTAWHWFGSLGVAPNGRIDACWYDTRSVADNHLSELYYTSSSDGGLTWTTNRPISIPFDHSVGYPTQEKLGDYIQLVSLNDAACIAYSATFNGEEDIWFVSVDQPLVISIAPTGAGWALSWKAATGRSFAVQMKTNLMTPWSSAVGLGTVIANNGAARFEDDSLPGTTDRFYRVVRLP